VSDSVRATRASVIIPAHDEAAVIARCLDTLLAEATPGEFEVVVAANGCRDDTAARASGRKDVQVLDLPAIGKTGALNEADRIASVFPRIYLDADVLLTTRAARLLVDALRTDAALVAAPHPRAVTGDCSRPVRWYYDFWSDLPMLREQYVGSGVFAVSAEGHQRLSPFPPIIADDQYVRRRFRREERKQVDSTFAFFPARNLSALVKRSIRVQAGNMELVAMVPDLEMEQTARGGAGVMDVLRRRPLALPKAMLFVTVGAVARWAARRLHRKGSPIPWNRDATTREA
jgi:glycosyltransferase involved in cell wall biosynthesis